MAKSSSVLLMEEPDKDFWEPWITPTHLALLGSWTVHISNRFLLLWEKKKKKKKKKPSFPAKNEFGGPFSTIIELNMFSLCSYKQFILKSVVGLFSAAKLTPAFGFSSLPGFHKEREREKKKKNYLPLNSRIIVALFVNRNNKNIMQQAKYFSHSPTLIFMTTLGRK